MAELAYSMYQITHRYVNGIIEEIPNVKISVIGGIQLNVSQPCGDMFVPMMFEVRTKGEPTKDLKHIFTEVHKYD